MDRTVSFIGGGQMAEAIFSGLLREGKVSADRLMVTDVSAARLEDLETRYHVKTVLNDEKGLGALHAADCDVLFLCVKPQMARAVLDKLTPALTSQLVISIMGGITLEFLEGQLPGAVIRVMPNTPMFVGCGAAGLVRGSRATKEDLAVAVDLFSAVGRTYVCDERMLDALTAISGCGPAFVYQFIEALADGGVEKGLPRAVAQELAAQTVMGAGKMVLESGKHPGQLKDSVCSPGGGTIAGVKALEQRAFRGAVMDAVDAAYERMIEVGKKA